MRCISKTKREWCDGFAALVAHNKKVGPQMVNKKSNTPRIKIWTAKAAKSMDGRAIRLHLTLVLVFLEVRWLALHDVLRDLLGLAGELQVACSPATTEMLAG